ncbi:MAG: DUF2490 domain-containing protein [Pseudomonadota bacterium]
MTKLFAPSALIIAVVLFAAVFAWPAYAQVDEDQAGLWSMYFWNADFGDSRFGLQGDVQYRQWDIGDDLEQLLLRGGLTWRPEGMTSTLLTLGYANITSEPFGPGNDETGENRVYQEALLSHQPADWLYLRHRFRYEQRWVDDQDFRTRFRYALFVDVPLNGVAPGPGSLYLALYNEVFINGERNIGDDARVQLFDRNRSYAALGYGLRAGLKMQFGYMHQESANFGKGQLQVSLHHKIR